MGERRKAVAPQSVQADGEPLERSIYRMQSRCEITAPKRRNEARCRPPRGCAWLRSDMVSSNEVGFNLRENQTLPRNTLHSCEWCHGYTGQQMNSATCKWVKELPKLRIPVFQPKVEVSHLNYLTSIWDITKSGMGCSDNRHLSHFVAVLHCQRGRLVARC
jgi:hypothetical protein